MCVSCFQWFLSFTLYGYYYVFCLVVLYITHSEKKIMYYGRELWDGTVRVYKLIKKGEEGRVYTAYDAKAKAVRAVKLKSRGCRFDHEPLTEAECMKILHSEYCLKIFRFYVDPWDCNLWLLMEFCNGGDLDEFVEKHSSLKENVLKSWMVQLLLGLLHIHANCIIHGDIKLANIMVHFPGQKDVIDTEGASSDDDDNVLNDFSHAILKIGDFGSSQRLSEGRGLGYRACGTPAFSSPEVIQCNPYSTSSDIWSLGVCFYAMMTRGRLPFWDEESPSALAEAIVQENPPHPCDAAERVTLPEGYSRELGDVVMSMLEKSESTRATLEDLLGNSIFYSSFDDLPWAQKICPAKPQGTQTAKRREVRCDPAAGTFLPLYSAGSPRPKGLVYMVVAPHDTAVEVHTRPYAASPVTQKLYYGDQVVVHPLAMVPTKHPESGSGSQNLESQPLELWVKVLHPFSNGFLRLREDGWDPLLPVYQLPRGILKSSVPFSPPSDGLICPPVIQKRSPSPNFLEICG